MNIEKDIDKKILPDKKTNRVLRRSHKSVIFTRSSPIIKKPSKMNKMMHIKIQIIPSILLSYSYSNDGNAATLHAGNQDKTIRK